MNERCCKCGQTAIRTLGTQPFCATCAEKLLTPVRERVIARYGRVDVVRNHVRVRLAPEHGDAMWELRCRTCDAGWVGTPHEPCPYCEERDEAERAHTRQRLLHPAWLVGRTDSRYDQLSDIDKRIWNETRGQSDESESYQAWVKRLAQAIGDGIINEAEARMAFRHIAR